MDSTGNLHLSKVGSTRVSTAGRCQEREFGIGVLHLDGDSIRIGSIQLFRSGQCNQFAIHYIIDFIAVLYYRELILVNGTFFITIKCCQLIYIINFITIAPVKIQT